MDNKSNINKLRRLFEEREIFIKKERKFLEKWTKDEDIETKIKILNNNNQEDLSINHINIISVQLNVEQEKNHLKKNP